MDRIKKIGLIPKMILGIALGILVGIYLPEWFIRIAISWIIIPYECGILYI